MCGSMDGSHAVQDAVIMDVVNLLLMLANVMVVMVAPFVNILLVLLFKKKYILLFCILTFTKGTSFFTKFAEQTSNDLLIGYPQTRIDF